MPLYSGGETPPRFPFRASPKPFVRLLIQCYSLKRADIRAFLSIGGRIAFDLYPPRPGLARGACTYT